MSKQGMQLSNDQVGLVEKLIAGVGGCQAVQAVAGSGKTACVTSMAVTLMQSLAHLEKILWVGRTRKMRQSELFVARRFVENPLEVIALGRRLEDSAKQEDEDECFFDAEVLKYLEGRVGVLKDELTSLQKELQEMPADMSLCHPDWPEWKQKSERMHLLSTRLWKAKLQALEDLFSHAKMFVFTVDAFIQISSGESVFSKLFARVTWKLCVVDEAHQLTLYQVAAVAFAS
eukprot:8975109-Karenia_brevis.AAC.1